MTEGSDDLYEEVAAVVVKFARLKTMIEETAVSRAQIRSHHTPLIL